MYRICEDGFKFKDGDLDYFIRNVRNTELGDWFRLAVQWDNYDVSDYIISQGYRVKNDMDVISDVLYYVDREMFEKIEYLFERGILLNETLLTKIAIRYYENIQYHRSENFLNQIFELYETEKNKTYQDVWGGY